MTKKQVGKISELEKRVQISEYQAKHYERRWKREREKRWTEDKLVEELKGVQSVVKPLKPYAIPKIPEGHREQELVMLFSDCQIGEKIQKKETGYRDYNIDIFKDRLKQLYDSTMNITERHRKDCTINNMNVFMLGDLVEGSKIFRGQGARIVTDEVEQMFEGQEMITNFLRSLTRHFKEINVACVYGNHGRVNERKDQDLGYVNWDYIMYKNIGQMLSGIPNVNMKVDKKWWRIEEVLGWKFYMEHGDRIKKYLTIPWYGLERGDNRILKMMRLMDKDYDYFVIGHHHVPFECDANRGERICNGTFSSGNPFAMRELKVAARPTQKLFGVHPEVGISFRYNVRLDFEGETPIK